MEGGDEYHDGDLDDGDLDDDDGDDYHDNGGRPSNRAVIIAIARAAPSKAATANNI